MISLLFNAANRAIVSSPELYLPFGAALLFLVISIPVFLLCKGRDLDGPYGLAAYALLVVLTTLYYRLPFLSMAETNPDESQEIAAALTLLHDPVYWRSVDMGTHGPLTTYPLMLPYLFGIPIDYCSTRIIGLAMLLASVLLIFLMFRKSIVNTMAIIAVLPIILFICLTDYWDFIAYNAEHPAALMVVLALYFTRNAFDPESRHNERYLYIAGVIAGSTLFVKIQCLPMVFAIAAGTCMVICFRFDSMKHKIRLAGIYALGAVTFPAFLFIYLIRFKIYDDFVMNYIVAQMNYSKDRLNIATKMNLFFQNLDWSNYFGWNYFGFLIFADIVMVIYLMRLVKGTALHPGGAGSLKSKISTADMTQLTVLFMVTVMSIVAIYVPGRAHQHYFLLLVFPLGILTGQLFIITYRAIDRTETRNIYVLLFVLVTAFGQYYYKYVLSSYSVLLLKNKLTYEALTVNSRFVIKSNEATDQAIVAAIREYASPGEKMIIWGWSFKYFVKSRLINGCKTSAVHLLTSQFGNKQYYLRSLMQELEAAEAPVLLDTVAKGQFEFNNKALHGFEQFPQLSGFIQDNYICMKNIEGVRVFVSKKRIDDITHKRVTIS